MPRYKDMPLDPGQFMLFGQCVDDALPSDNDVRAFAEVMDCLDYSDLESKCSETGCPPYAPKTMVKILAYGYCKGLRSSRKIEEALKIDVRFIWLAGGLKPDYSTISRFRKSNGTDFESMFKESVKLCMNAGLVFLNSVSVDGTKIVAAASKKRIYNEQRVEQEMKRVEQILREAEEVDRLEDELYGTGNGQAVIPDEMKDAKLRKQKLERLAKELKESKSKNTVASDPECRVMKTRNNGKCPGYNLQAAVDSSNQVIVAMKLTASETDHGYLPEMVEQVESNTGLSPGITLADSGYSDERTFAWTGENERDILLPPLEQPATSKSNDLFASKCFERDDERDVLVCPAGKDLTFRGQNKLSSGEYRQYAASECRGCSLHDDCCGKESNRRINVSITFDVRRRMRERLQTKDGRELYSLRKQTVEPVFGEMKSNRGFSRLLLHGYKGALAETALMCLIHNVCKCMGASATAQRPDPAKQQIAAALILFALAALHILHKRRALPRCSRSYR